MGAVAPKTNKQKEEWRSDYSSQFINALFFFRCAQNTTRKLNKFFPTLEKMQIILKLRTRHRQVSTLSTVQDNPQLRARSKRLISQYGDKPNKRIQTFKSIL